MKLLVVSHSCAEVSNQRLYVELQALTGWEVTLALPARWKDEFGNTLDAPPVPELARHAVKIPVLANGNIILHVYVKNWGEYLRRENFDAIYVNHEPYALATAQISFANSRLPRPATFGFYSCQNICKSYPFPISAFESSVYRNSQFAFPITTEVADVLARKNFGGLSTVCALPLDPAHYFPRGETHDRELVPRGQGTTVIGFVGRFIEAKGLRTFAAALAHLKDLDWKLMMIGSGAFEGEFRTLLAAEGLSDRVHFSGYIPHDETPRYLSAFDILVLPSETQANWKEQFGRVITEAMACGTAVIGSDSGEIPNLIRASQGGLVFPERDANAFARALRSYIESPSLRGEAAVRGMQWTSSNVTLNAVAGKMASTIREAYQPSESHVKKIT